MIKHIVQTYKNILKACLRTYGFGKVFLFWLSMSFIFIRVHFFLFLDNVFYPGFRHVTIKNPIFIIGNPRSGTSFVHYLLSQAKSAAVFNTWQIIFPSLFERKFLHKIIKGRIKKKGGALLSAEIGHRIDLDRAEEEELLFLYVLNTQFVITMSPLAFDDVEYPELIYFDRQTDDVRKKSARFFKNCLKRHLYYTKKEQIVAQMHFSTFRIKTLLEFFPDAKFIYLVRSPVEVIPSQLSLIMNVIDKFYGVSNIPEKKIALWYKRRYNLSVSLYQYFENMKKSGIISEKNCMEIPYNRLLTDLTGVFNDIATLTGLKTDDDLIQSVKKIASIQKNYKRKHEVKELSDFGLTKKNILQDLSFVFERYHFEK